MIGSCQTPPDGRLEQLGTTLEVELLLDPRPISLHGADVDMERLRDLIGAVSQPDLFEDLQLAFRKAMRDATWAAAFSLQ